MGVITSEIEITTAISPAKMFKAFVLDGSSLAAKALPQAISSVIILEGDGGPGTIKQINFGNASQLKYLKQRTDAIGMENFSYANTVFEGDALINKFEKISNEYKFEPFHDGGSICKNSKKFYTLGDIEIEEEVIQASNERARTLFKAIETYLLANPEA